MNTIEEKRMEAEKCNGWLRKVSVLYLCVYYCGGDGCYDDEIYDGYKRRTKELFAPLVSKYLNSLESDDKEQKKNTILSIINHFDKEFFKDINYPSIYQYGIRQCRNGYFKSPNNIRIEDPRIFWFRKLVEEDISGVEICRMLLTCQELGEYEIGISLGQAYIRNNEKRLNADLTISLINKHIEVLQEKLRARIEYEDREDRENLNSIGISARDYLKELEEDSWEAMTGGMYGEYDGDIDMDKLGY